MAVVNVPIQLNQYFLILVIVGGGKPAGIKTVFILEYLNGAIDFGLRYPGNSLYGLRIRRSCRVEFLVAEEKKQFVFDDRAAKRSPKGGFVKIPND